MYIYMYMNTYISIYLYIYIPLQGSGRTSEAVRYMSSAKCIIYIAQYICICICIYVYIYIYIHIHIYFCIHSYVCICICIYVFIRRWLPAGRGSSRSRARPREPSSSPSTANRYTILESGWGKYLVNSRGMLPDSGSILRGVHFWEVPFACMLSPGWVRHL